MANDPTNQVTLPSWVIGAGLVVIAGLGAGLVVAMSDDRPPARYAPAADPSPAPPAPDAPAPGAPVVEAAADPTPLDQDTAGVPARLFTTTGDADEDEARIAQAKLMGLGHTAGEGAADPSPARAPAEDPAPAADDEPDEPRPANPVGHYLDQLDKLSAGLSVDDPDAFGQAAVEAAQKGDTSRLEALKKKYEQASRDLLALHAPAAASEHKAATLAAFSAATGMLGRLIVALSAGDVAAIATIGDDAKALQATSEKVDELTAALEAQARDDG